ncbi:hypothetical protein TIFTF001_020946 [Ficus carica]|uniref:Uncharacterized protein n=1 Tax=Ficus carica TaxID=3494 RepID=A0AA88DAA1_FICCA|nr:hypothetical protein TIFTF001_020946 [Ficus carica]
MDVQALQPGIDEIREETWSRSPYWKARHDRRRKIQVPLKRLEERGEWLLVTKYMLIQANQKKQGLDYQILDTIFLVMERLLPRHF